MRLKLIFTMVICALVPFAVGCARQTAMTGSEPEPPADVAVGIPLAPDFRIADIPVPAGFEFDREHSFVFQNNVVEVGRIQYAGKERINDVAQFYLDEMPRYGWSLLNMTEYGTIILFFEKEGESAIVTLLPKARGTLAQISFFPKAAQPTP